MFTYELSYMTQPAATPWSIILFVASCGECRFSRQRTSFHRISRLGRLPDKPARVERETVWPTGMEPIGIAVIMRYREQSLLGIFSFLFYCWRTICDPR